MKLSSVSPERWETIAVQPRRLAISMASMVSVTVPIWLSLIRIELAAFSSIPLLEALDVGDEEVVADELDLVAEGLVEELHSPPSRPRPGRPPSRGSDIS